MKPRVLVTRAILPEPLSRLHQVAQVEIGPEDRGLTPAELQRQAAGCTGLLTHLTDRVDDALLRAAGPQLKIVANYAVGHNNIDLAACRAHGVWATNTPGVLTEATADITLALMLAVTRRVVEGDRLVRSGGWTGWAPTQLLGGDLADRTLGIIGCGRIGQAVAQRARAFGMELIYTQTEPLPAAVEAAQGLRFVTLAELLAQADIVTVHCPLTAATRHLLGARELAAMKSSAYLINTARGPVVDEAALVAALGDGQLAGAGLDVYEEEPRLAPGLVERDNLVLLPHLGSATTATRRRMGEVAVRNIIAALGGEAPPDKLP